MALVYTSRDLDIFVVDIPASIEHAHGGGRTYSSQALETPFATPEPRGKKLSAFVSKLPADHVTYHNVIQAYCEVALKSVDWSFDSQKWHLPRTHNLGIDDVPIERAVRGDERACLLPIVLSATQNDFAFVRDVQNELVHNDYARTAYLVFMDNVSMLVPGHCTFMWGSIKRGLGAVSERSTSTYGDPPQFDVILMDPPWANRSVRHTQGYHTTEEQSSDPFEEALTFLDHLHPEGHVAIWITNKAAVRCQVLASMARLGFDLVEEWIWLKVTTKGEPVTPLHGVWRKPYEVLLIFRRGHLSAVPTRRVVIAVPDLHSRKPNLKTLFEQLLHSQLVLELFARNLTSGWWCFGDEVLKFQDTRFWHLHPP